MEIRKLFNEELEIAMKLKVRCWDEELAGVAPNRLKVEDELEFVVGWLQSASQYNDTRVMLGAFEEDTLMGFVGASIADESDKENAVELNYLFVNPNCRGRGLSLRLIREVIHIYIKKQFKYLVVYNHHYAPSNNYYQKLGGHVIRQDKQGELNVDIFLFDLINLDLKLKQIIDKRYNY